jgi:hypothetical protein
MDSSIALPSPSFPSFQQRPTPANVPFALFPHTPNMDDSPTVPSVVDPRQLSMPFVPLVLPSTHDSPTQIGGTIPDVCSDKFQAYKQGRASTLRLAGPAYGTHRPNALFGWTQSQFPYPISSDALSPTSPSRFQVPPASPSVPPTPALLSPSRSSTLYGTPPIIESPMVSRFSSSHPLPTQTAMSGPQTRQRMPSYAEILARGTPSTSCVAPSHSKTTSAVGPSVPPLPVQPRNSQPRHRRLAPSHLRNVVIPLPIEPASTMDPTRARGSASIPPHHPISIAPEAQNYHTKLPYVAPNPVNTSGVLVNTQRRMYSDAVKGKTKDPVQCVKMPRLPSSQSVPTSSLCSSNTSSVSLERHSRAHSRAGPPYPPSPLPNLHQLQMPPGSAECPSGPSKTKFKGKRQGVDQRLRTAFADGGPHKILLDRILGSAWCQRDEEEPTYGSQQDQVTTDLALPTLQIHKSILFAFAQTCIAKDEYQCLICAKRLRTQRVLRHIRSHFDIRPFACNECPDCHQSK